MSTKKHVQTAEEKSLQLSKTLCYLLRHGLAVEGLKVYTGNYVLQDELLALPQLRKFTARDLDENVKKSISIRFGTPRFEQLILQGLVFIRAANGQSGNITIEPFPENLEDLRNAYKVVPPERVSKLYTLCLKNIIKNIKLYEDFSGVGDSSIVESIMNECKSQNKLNNANLKLFLIDELDRLDIGEGLAITDSTLRRIGKQCPKLKSMRLVDCVALTDTQVQFLAKNCNQLWSVELEGCKYVSDTGLNHLATHLKKTIKSITLKGLPSVSVKGLESFLAKCDQMNSVTIANCELLNPENVNVEDLKDKFKLKQLQIVK